MILWMILTTMVSLAAVLVAAPFMRRSDGRRTDQSSEIMVYRDQLGEIERETRDGLIDADQARAARIEIERRLLAADRAASTSRPPTAKGHGQVAMLGVTAVVVLGSVGVYAITGRPEVPAARGTSEADAVARLAALTRSEAPPGHERNDPSAQLAPVDEMIDRLMQRLQRAPKDAEGWRMLGWSYFATERYSQAVEAYAKAVALNPNGPSLHASYGEALVRAANSQVTPQARAVFKAAIEADPRDPRARFFRGLAQEQDGAKAEALDEWIAILKDADPAEPWVGDLEQRVGELAREMGVDLTQHLGQRAKPATGGVLALLETQGRAPLAGPSAPVPGAAERGPTPRDVRDAEALSPADRMALIRGMVAGLADRLKQSPKDQEGWIKLMRSYMVLGESAEARAALRQALQAFHDAPPVQGQITAAARELGINP